MSFTRVQFFKDLCHQMGNASPSTQVLDFLVGWSVCETNTNSGARFNLLNTTQPFEGASNFNSVGVRNYPNYQAGIEATKQTLDNGFYPTIAQSIQDNIVVNLTDNPPTEVVNELHTWSGDPNGYGGGLVSLGNGHLNDDFSYGSSPFSQPIPAFHPTQNQLVEAQDRWQSFLKAPMGTGIYQSWLKLYVEKVFVFGPPITKEKSGKNWEGNDIVYQIFASATCEWDGVHAHWYDGRGKIIDD